MGVRRVRGALLGVLEVLTRSGGQKPSHFLGVGFGRSKSGSILEGPKPRFRRVEISTFWGRTGDICTFGHFRGFQGASAESPMSLRVIFEAILRGSLYRGSKID